MVLINITHILKSIAVLCSMAMLFSCSNDMKKVQKMNQVYKFPQGEAYNFKLVYTDSAKVVAILTSPKNDDYSNQKFPYSEFPEGVKVEFFDAKQQKNTVEANYGIIYTKTQLVELRDSVVLTTFDGKMLKTSQLYWDQKQDWIFTEKNFTFTDEQQGSVTHGIGMDFDKNFSTVRAHRTTGVVPIPDEKPIEEEPRTPL
ncbi:MAG: LPS export ABC transporter periplasmic protein LptC [Capnocytophaga sp.]|nr:LPS export ABC transporter periplasmic protein LptC [Capnocytophaga sp.]